MLSCGRIYPLKNDVGGKMGKFFYFLPYKERERERERDSGESVELWRKMHIRAKCLLMF